MSKQHFERSLRKELKVLNEVIDARIMRGLSYARESKRHKMILSSLSKIRRTDSRVGWPVRAFSTFSII